MRKLMLIAVFFIMMGISAAAQNAPAKVERNGNCFMPAKKANTKSEPVGIPYFWEYKGEKYPIFMGPSGSCFYYRKKKDGTEYRQYVPKEVSAQICKEMGVEYKHRTNN